MGSDFYLAFAPKPNVTITVAVTTSEPNGANFTLECSNPVCVNAGYPLFFSIQNREVVNINIPSELITSSSLERNMSIHLSAHDEKKVSVFGYIDGDESDEIFSAIPCDSIKSPFFDRYEYLTLHASHPNMINNVVYESMILMIPCEDMTTITVYPSQNIPFAFNDLYMYGNVNQAGPSLPSTSASFIANSGNTLYLGGADDLSGSIVISDKPLVLYAGHHCALVPSTDDYCDHLFEQIPPSFTYGTTFLLTSLGLRETGELYRIGTCLDGTEVNLACIQYGQTVPNVSVTHQNATIDRGQWVQFTTVVNPLDRRGDFCTLESNYPVLVMHYSQGRSLDSALRPHSDLGDPAMFMIPPVTQFSNNYTVINFVDANSEYGIGYVNLAVHSNFATNISLRTNTSNDTRIIDSGWNPFYCQNSMICGYGIQVFLDDYVNYIYINDPDPQAALGAIMYGFEDGGAFGTGAGMTLSPIGGE